MIRTNRLVLRPITTDDVGLLVELDRDPEVMRYINGGRPSTRAEVTAIVEEAIGCRWIVQDAATGEFLGWAALRPTPDRGPRTYELGYRLRREAWGQGYATEASRALLAKAFDELDAQTVWAQTMTVNERSRRVMERCGLRYVRTFHLDWPPDQHIDGTAEGDVEYAIQRPDWHRV